MGDSDAELEEELEEILNSGVKDAFLPSVPDTSLPDLEKELEALKFRGNYYQFFHLIVGYLIYIFFSQFSLILGVNSPQKFNPQAAKIL